MRKVKTLPLHRPNTSYDYVAKIDVTAYRYSKEHLKLVSGMTLVRSRKSRLEIPAVHKCSLVPELDCAIVRCGGEELAIR